MPTTPPHHQRRESNGGGGGGFVAPPTRVSPLLLFRSAAAAAPTAASSGGSLFASFHQPLARRRQQQSEQQQQQQQQQQTPAAEQQQQPEQQQHVPPPPREPGQQRAASPPPPVPMIPRALQLVSPPQQQQQPQHTPIHPSPLRQEMSRGEEAGGAGEARPGVVPTTWRVDTFCRVKPEFAANSSTTSLGPKHVRHIPFELRNGTGVGALDPPFRTLRLTLAPSGWNSRRQEGMDFEFTEVFPPDVDQAAVYDRVARNVVDSVLQGYNGTVFAYGQTGSGKTFTMTGGETFAERGLIPRAITDVYTAIKNRPDRRFRVLVSYMEIYNEGVYDLLDVGTRDKPLEEWTKIMMMDDEDGEMHLRNLKLYEATTEEDALNLLFLGNWNRITSETPMNEASTRSHCIFTIRVSSEPLLPSQGTSAHPSKSLFGKLNLVDLAGSERMYKTDAQQAGGGGGGMAHHAKTRMEGRYINLSLHYLEQVIVALQEKARRNEERSSTRSSNGGGDSSGGGTPRGGARGGGVGGAWGPHYHIPYRNSVMTSILRDSLGGNCRTVFVVTLNTEVDHVEESISTCRFAQRCAQLSTDVLANEALDPDQLAASLKAELVSLRAKAQRQEQSLETATRRIQELEAASAERSLTPAELRLCREVVRDFLLLHSQQGQGSDDTTEEAAGGPAFAWVYRLDRALVARCCLLLRRQGREALRLAEETAAARAHTEERLRLTLAAGHNPPTAEGDGLVPSLQATSTSALALPEQEQQSQRRERTTVVVPPPAHSSSLPIEEEERPQQTAYSFGLPFPPPADAVPLVGRELRPDQTVLFTTHYKSHASLDESAAAGLLRLAEGDGGGESGSVQQGEEGQRQRQRHGHAGPHRWVIGTPKIGAEEEESETEEEKRHRRLLTEGQTFYKLGRGGRKHARFVWVSHDLATLFWRKASSGTGAGAEGAAAPSSSSSSLGLTDCQRVAAGREASGQHSSGGGNGQSTNACLTVYTGDRYVTFEVVDPITRAPEQERRIRDAWMQALAFALQKQQRQRRGRQTGQQQQQEPSAAPLEGGMRSHRPGPGSRSLSPPPISTKPRPGADTAAVASSSLSPPRIRGGGGGSSHASGGGGHYPIYPPVTALRTSEQPPPPRHQRPTAARRACLLAEHTHAHSSSGGSSSRRVGLSSSSSLSFPAPPEHYHTAATPLDRPPSNRAPRSRSPPPLPPPLPSSSSPPPAHRRQAAAAAHSGYYPIYPPVPLRSSSLAFAERECHRRPPPPLAPEDLSPARAAADEEGQPYSAAPHFLFPSGGQSRRAGAAEAGAGIGGYAAQHTHKQHHHGSVARAVGGAGELSGELRGYAEYLSPGGMGGRQEGSWRLGSDVQRKGGALLRPSRYSAYQERRPFY